MISRRDFIQASLAAWALLGGALPRLARAQGLTEDALAEFSTTGNVTLIHVTDIHAQLRPVFIREPSINIGVGENAGLVPHVTGADCLKLYDIEPGSVHAYALTSEGFESLALEYGRPGRDPENIRAHRTCLSKTGGIGSEERSRKPDSASGWQTRSATAPTRIAARASARRRSCGRRRRRSSARTRAAR